MSQPVQIENFVRSRVASMPRLSPMNIGLLGVLLAGAGIEAFTLATQGHSFFLNLSADRAVEDMRDQHYYDRPASKPDATPPSEGTCSDPLCDKPTYMGSPFCYDHWLEFSRDIGR